MQMLGGSGVRSGRHRGAASADKGEMKTATLAFDDGATTIDLHAADEQAHRIRHDDIWANFNIDTIGCLVPNEASDIIADPRR
ncbi:protein of unknown function [Methylorubrum extorquens]|uniref:Uncharacterized protein n=1 Tax=Methylorubrum extorquens TaxID=408 RepID=A0A2N9AKH9_METEX|nr:hypothetical protein B2G69_02905 [Methylorubrum zatmanii]SOR27849.1 protein of unknown function [Methylorubrum extorquens]